MDQILASIGARKRLAITLIGALAATLFAIQIAGSASAATKHRIKHHAHTSGGQGAATGLGQLNGLLPRNKPTLESAMNVNLSNETVRLPIYPGMRRFRATQVRPRGSGTSCWTPPTKVSRTTWA